VKNFADYPQMTDIEGNLRMVMELGYEDVGHLILPDSAWVENYYGPMERKVRVLERRYKGNEAAMEVIRGARFEMDVFCRHSDYFAYAFFVMRKH